AHSYTFSSCFSLWPFALFISSVLLDYLLSLDYLLCVCFSLLKHPCFSIKEPLRTSSCHWVLSLAHWAKRWFPTSSISDSIPEKSLTQTKNMLCTIIDLLLLAAKFD